MDWDEVILVDGKGKEDGCFFFFEIVWWGFFVVIRVRFNFFCLVKL